MATIKVDIKKNKVNIDSKLSSIGKWWMNPWVYDPDEIKADVFDMDNMKDGEEKHYVTTEQIESWNGKQDALTAGENVSIDDNVISAVDTTYTAGEWISIDENNVISNTQTSAEWWNIQWDIEDQEDLQLALWEKQDNLTAWENINIENNVISAVDTTYESCDFDINDLSDACGCRQTWNWKQDELTAGENIDITNNVISATDTTYESCDFDIKDLADSCSCRQTWNAKQNALTAGDNITINNDTISATDTIPNNAKLTIQKNWTKIDDFTADASEDKTINITVPVTATDVNALPDTTKYGASVDLSINSSTYVVTLTLKDQNWDTLWSAQTIDLPLESVVVSWSYDADTKEVVLVLEWGSEIRFSVADLVSGLQTEITVDNKLSSDLVDDTNHTNKFVTAADICNWNAKPDTCDIPTDNCQLANSCGFTTCTWTLVARDIENLAQCCDIPTDNCQLWNSCWYIKWINCSDVTTALWYTPYSNTNPAWYTTCTGTLVPSDIENLAQCCDIPTDNCQLANGCGFTTCTWTLVASDIENLAQCCDIPTDNCQLANGCWFTTCTGTLVASDIENLAQCCDIPTDNCQLWNGCGYITCSDLPDLSGYQLKCNMVCNLTDADNNHYPTAKAVADAMACAWVWDMLKSVYDPCGCEWDAFNACNMYNMPHIPTDNCELGNSCGYTTCTWTLVESDLACYAKCADIPTNNCQLTNGCGYIKWINCSDVTTALGFTPYNSTNPAGYTTCTGTLVASDIENLAQCCDIPTDNCQLGNSCNYATCCYVNDSINSVTAYYITKDAQWNQFATYAELNAATTFYSGWQVRVPTKNDYTIVIADENHDDATTRYIYNNWWEYQYTVNETALTQEQLDALNSWITSSKVSCYDWVVSTVSWFWDIVSCDACDFAKPSDIPTDNCQLANSCGYTTCTWTLVPSDLCCYAKCADIPTNNCQLTNGCWYIKWINCSDVTTALWFTPYNSTNPSWYTTCTWTLVASDIENLAQCCDIPTDNCQLANSCWYTTCTWTLVASDIENLAQCCDIPTNNCQLTNWCWYIKGINCSDVTTALWYTPYNSTNPSWYTTCTWTLVASDIECLAQCCDIPTDNCQLANSCGFTTCTGTLVASDIQNLAKCCDIPTNNCQLTNGCGYIKGINCSDVTTALGFTPYSNANPAGYTTCTGTLVASDLNNYAKCCDIPTDNCQLANWCWYTTCTWTLVASDIENLAQCCDIPTNNCQLTNGCWYTTCTWTLNWWDLKTINGCCLVWSWDICIQGWGWIDNLPWSPICICYKWTGSAECFACLWTYRCDTEYNVIE